MNQLLGRRAAILLSLAFALTSVVPASAQTQPKLFGEEKEAPTESEWILPAAPQEANWVPFYVSPITSNRFFIDAQSVSVSADGIVRYTLLALSQGGARNISFEGLNCGTDQRRIFAFGRRDGSWGLARNSQWEKVSGVSMNRQHSALADDLFCRGSKVPDSASTIVARLRSESRNVR